MDKQNKLKMIKCPRCGSVDTAEILYGLPAFDDELAALLDAGRIHLGGCCRSGFDPRYYCNTCQKSFGATAVTRDGINYERFAEIVNEVHFSRTAARSMFNSYEITVKKTKNGARVYSDGMTDRLIFNDDCDISSKCWARLVSNLYDSLFLSDWKHTFKPVGYSVLDGESWRLEIKMTGNRKRTYSGDNAYPPYWRELDRLMRSVTKPMKAP